MVADDVFTRLTLGTAALLGLLLLLSLLAPPGGIPPCQDDLAFDSLASNVSLESNRSAETVTATLEVGDRFTSSNTIRLFLRFRDPETGKTATVTWAPDGVGSFPVDHGDRVTVHWDTAGEWVEPGDIVRVIWRGHETNRPDWCPGNRPANSTFAKTTL